MALIERFTPGGNLYPDGSSTFVVLVDLFRRMAENRDTRDQAILTEAKNYTDNNGGGGVTLTQVAVGVYELHTP